MSLKWLFLILPLFLACQTSNHNTLSNSISWNTWEEGETLAQKEDKKILVWVYDPTCSTCAEAEERIFTHPEVNDYLYQHFYPIKLSGKRKTPIVTKGKTYNFIRGFRGDEYHELAAAITQEKEGMSYPRIAFLDKNMDLIVPIEGNIELEELEMLLAFVAQDQFKEMNIEQYKLTHKPITKF